jgi:hypothetical protein
MSCGVLNNGISIDCDNGMVSGAQEDVYLINFDDWQAATVNVAANNVYDSITLASGDSLFKIEGAKASVEPLVEARTDGFINGYNHQVRIRVFKATAEAKAEVEEILNGRLSLLW